MNRERAKAMGLRRKIAKVLAVVLLSSALLLTGCQKESGSTSDSSSAQSSAASSSAASSSAAASSVQEPADSSEIVPPQEVVVQQQVEADYEKWLASAAILGISMEYPDFELEGIYAASATALSDKQSSKGVYVLFQSGGSRYAIHSAPLTQERTQPGTIDLSSVNMGFSTFDLVDADSISAADMVELSMEELKDTLSQSLLVSLYYH